MLEDQEMINYDRTLIDIKQLRKLIKRYPDEAIKIIRALPSNVSGLSNDETMRRIQLGQDLENISEKEKLKGITTEIKP